jgi:hypothetical protein
MARGERRMPGFSIQFGAEEWQEEVERYQPSAIPRALAQSARRVIEAGSARLDWKRCRFDDGPSGTRLPHCLKLYLPLDKEGASAAPYGFVFQLQRMADDSPTLNFVALASVIPTTSGGG